MFRKYTLLRSQRKMVFEILRDKGLSPADFEWSRVTADDKSTVTRLSYREGDYYFQFSSYGTGAHCIVCPGLNRLVAYDYPRDWAEQANHFRNWAEHLRREIECRDPWEELAKYRIDVAGVIGGTDEPNETISGVEAQAIGRTLATLAALIAVEFDLAEEPAAVVRERLGYLAEAAMRQRSRDWAYSVLGVCSTLAMALSLEEHEAARLWSLFKEQLGTFIHPSERPIHGSIAGP